MKRLIFLFVFLGTFLTTFSQQKSISDEIQIQNLIQESFDVLFSSYELDQLDKFYTPDIKILENGEIWDMEIIKGILENGKKRSSSERVNKLEFIETRVDQSMGYAIYHNYATISAGGKTVREIHWIESVIAVKTANGWRIKNLHSFPAAEK